MKSRIVQEGQPQPGAVKAFDVPIGSIAVGNTTGGLYLRTRQGLVALQSYSHDFWSNQEMERWGTTVARILPKGTRIELETE